jgi:exonuclease III
LEATSWDLFKHTFGVADFFNAGWNLRFSWDNRRNGARILARLDRFYISEKGLNNDMVEEYRIRGDSGFSDHLPVSLRINLKKERRQSCCYKMNSSWLADPIVKAETSRM